MAWGRCAGRLVRSGFGLWVLTVCLVPAAPLGGAGEGAARVPVPLFVSWGGIGAGARIPTAARIGINLHRLPVGWPSADGGYDFRATDANIRALHRAGIKVILHFFNHGVPQWFWKAHPDARPQDAQGRFTEDYPSPWNPAVRAAIQHNMAAILKHLKEAHLLGMVDGVEIGVGMEGQLSYLWDTYRASDRWAVRAYRRYLTGIYGEDIAQLNRDWGTHYPSFDAITPPEHWQDTLECHTFEEFYKQGLLDAALAYAGVVRRYFRPRIWYWMAHFIKYPERHYAARYPLEYIRRLRELGMADVVQTSSVPGWETRAEVRGLQQLGVRVVGEIAITPSPEEQREDAVTAKGLGCDGFFVGTLENLFDAQGRPLPAGDETARLIAAWRAGRPL
ncbi:MAG: beta-galactosidase [Chthonomonadales bacterium]